MTDRKTQDALLYASNHFDETLDQLKELVRIPGISFKDHDPLYLEQTADACMALLKKTGLGHVKKIRVKNAPPYVYGDWLHARNPFTILLYAHYDVQPPLRETYWHSPPYEPLEKNGRLYGRGTADDKAGILIHAASIHAWLKTAGSLPVNIKVIIEGEEETGSRHFRSLLEQYSHELNNDCLIVADMSNFDTGFPAIICSIRGLVSVELFLQTMDHPLHSGMWGGPLPDPILAMAKILSGLVDRKGRIAIPGLYPMIRPLSGKENKQLSKLPLSISSFRKQAGLLSGVPLFPANGPVWKQLWREPSLAVNSIESGSRKGAGNVIMNEAWCRIGIRTVNDMKPEKVMKLLVRKIQSLVPWGAKLKIIPDGMVDSWIADISHPAYELMKQAMTSGYGKAPVFAGSGGSIPLVFDFSKIFPRVPVLLTGVEDPCSQAHSENESLSLLDFKKAIYSQIHFFEKAGESF
ncbi:MAG: M20/M25/M40 family metallo-hydrolase [Candidatus Aureabacteria bacterium]|nr:M20/M25/M40 family metallo-hydrolase [Candidatus Auribacterota bacterium]